MSDPKDNWDKAEIVGKVLVPVVLGMSVWLWNAERTEQQTTATMTRIALGVLTEEPNDAESDALRQWAIEVLRMPANPPPLSDAAALELKSQSLTWVLSSDGITGVGGTNGLPPEAYFCVGEVCVETTTPE